MKNDNVFYINIRVYTYIIYDIYTYHVYIHIHIHTIVICMRECFHLDRMPCFIENILFSVAPRFPQAGTSREIVEVRQLGEGRRCGGL